MKGAIYPKLVLRLKNVWSFTSSPLCIFMAWFLSTGQLYLLLPVICHDVEFVQYHDNVRVLIKGSGHLIIQGGP
jgi:hypothetical protein